MGWRVGESLAKRFSVYLRPFGLEDSFKLLLFGDCVVLRFSSGPDSEGGCKVFPPQGFLP